MMRGAPRRGDTQNTRPRQACSSRRFGSQNHRGRAVIDAEALPPSRAGIAHDRLQFCEASSVVSGRGCSSLSGHRTGLAAGTDTATISSEIAERSQRPRAAASDRERILVAREI